MSQEVENNFDIITGLKFGNEPVVEETTTEPQVDAEVENPTDAPTKAEGAEAQETEAQPTVDELLAKIKELEEKVSQPNNEAINLLQDRQVLQSLAKDYEQMPLIDLLREDFDEKHHGFFEKNPNIDQDLAFRKYLQRVYNPDIEPLIEDTLGLDEYDLAVLEAQAQSLREEKMQRQVSIQQAISGQSVQKEGVQEENQLEPGSIAEYEQRLFNHIETSLKGIKPSALEVEGFQIPSVGEDRIKELVNTLSIEEMPLMVAQDNNVYPHLGLLKEIADYRELSKNLPDMLKAFREKIVAETVENLKKNVSNKSDFNQSPGNPYSGDVISPRNIGDYNITGLKL
jgi:hypothetical protein